jgi:tetratricopeptide (TPR) repeat protein
MGLVDPNQSTDHRLGRENWPIPLPRARVRLTRRLNLRFLTVLLVLAVTCLGGMHLLHEVQIRRNASDLLRRASRAEARDDLETAEQSLRQYLKIKREDGTAWKWYARIVDEHDSDRRQRDQVLLVHEQALRYNRGDLKLERRCALLALERARYTKEVGWYNDAQRRLSNLIEKLPTTSQGQPLATELAELEDLLGQCDHELNHFESAEKWFLLALQHDPAQVSCYDRLARLRRDRLWRLRSIEAADATIREMVAKNPKVGLAFIYRWRYAQEFLPPADATDIQKALELAPDDPEVLLTAAVASEQKPDPAAARHYFEKGWKLHPKNLALALGLARLETREQHPEQGEAVLRQAFQAHPSLTLAFELAEILILQDKIEGKEQAVDYLTLLRNAGLGGTLVPYLEAEILVRRQRWSEAIPTIKMARAVLSNDQRLTVKLDLMLAECFGRLGSDDQRLDALRSAVGADPNLESARIDLARAMARSGNLERAIAILSPLVDRRPELRLDLARLLIEKASRQTGGRPDWKAAEGSLREAEKALPQAIESLTLLRVDLLAGQHRLDDARSLLSSVLARDPRNLRLRLTLARLTQRQDRGPAALQILDRIEEDLGPSLETQLARLDFWGLQGGVAARDAVAKLAEKRRQIRPADLPVFLDRLAAVEIRLGQPHLARDHLRELVDLRPASIQVLMSLFDVALQTADYAGARELVSRIRTIEGEEGTLWRFARASYMLDEARRGVTNDLEASRVLAAEIAARRTSWWGSFVLRAEIAELEGQTERAIKNYLQAIELGNTQATLARRLVGLLHQMKQFDQIDRVVEILSDRGIPAGDLMLSAALSAVRRHDYDRGIALARQVFPERSTRYSDHLFLGQFYLAAHRPREAGEALRRAVELGPGVPITWVTYVQYLVLEKQSDQASAAVEAARKSLPADRADLALAQCYAMLGRTREAEARVQAALKSPACDLTAIRVAVDLYINQGRFDRVEPILDKLDAVASGRTPDVLAWANRTRSLARLSAGRPSDLDRALTLIELNLKANPSSLEDQRLKAVLLALKTSRRGDAIKLLEPLDQSGQLGTNEQFILAQTYLSERLFASYERQMEKVLGSGVKNPRHLIHFVEFLVGRGELGRAERWIVEAIRESPAAASLLRPKLAAIYCRQERHDEAEALLRQVLAADPANVEALNNLAWELALREPARPREALTLIDRAIEKRGPIATFVDTRAVALIQNGEPDRAAQELRTVQSADPRNLSLALHLAWAYQSSGKAEAARQAFELAQELGLKPETRHPLERGFVDRLSRQFARSPEVF